jgi:hypothetical protein
MFWASPWHWVDDVHTQVASKNKDKDKNIVTSCLQN